MGRRMMDQADCVLVFGAGLNFLTMSFGAAVPQVPIIQVDSVRAHIGRWPTADVAAVGEARRSGGEPSDDKTGGPGSAKALQTAQNPAPVLLVANRVSIQAPASP